MSKLIPPLTIAILAALASAPAAEIVLRRDARITSSIVTLADVAEIGTSDRAEAERLGSLELGLAPATGERRLLRLREIEDALTVAGENRAGHRLSGASEIALLGPAPERDPLPEAPQLNRPTTPARHDRVERALTEAVLEHLRAATEQRHGWTVRLHADADTLAALEAAESFVVSGGQPPFAGRQSFRVVGQTVEGPQEFAVSADIEQAPACVVLKRAISRGTVLGPGDLELAVPREGSVKPTDSVFNDVEQVYGKELLQTTQAGAVLKASQLQSPILVKRGQAVTVYSRAAGVTVRTTARAKDDGSLSALIAVETIDTRQAYFAKVCGPQEVEVVAASPAEAARTAAKQPAAVTQAAPVVAEPAPPVVAAPSASTQVAFQESPRAARSSWLSPRNAAAPSDGLKWRARSTRPAGEDQ